MPMQVAMVVKENPAGRSAYAGVYGGQGKPSRKGCLYRRLWGPRRTQQLGMPMQESMVVMKTFQK